MYIYIIYISDSKGNEKYEVKNSKDLSMDYANTMAAMSALTRSLVLFVSSPDCFAGPVYENSRGPAESHYANLPQHP